jgi:hypothetical protein
MHPDLTSSGFDAVCDAKVLINGEVAIYLAFARGTRSPPSRPPSGNGCAEEANDRLNDTPEHVPRQHRGLARDEVVTRGEQLARAGVADDAQRPERKCRVIQIDGLRPRMACS